MLVLPFVLGCLFVLCIQWLHAQWQETQACQSQTDAHVGAKPSSESEGTPAWKPSHERKQQPALDSPRAQDAAYARGHPQLRRSVSSDSAPSSSGLFLGRAEHTDAAHGSTQQADAQNWEDAHPQPTYVRAKSLDSGSPRHGQHARSSSNLGNMPGKQRLVRRQGRLLVQWESRPSRLSAKSTQPATQRRISAGQIPEHHVSAEQRARHCFVGRARSSKARLETSRDPTQTPAQPTAPAAATLTAPAAPAAPAAAAAPAEPSHAVQSPSSSEGRAAENAGLGRPPSQARRSTSGTSSSAPPSHTSSELALAKLQTQTSSERSSLPKTASDGSMMSAALDRPVQPRHPAGSGAAAAAVAAADGSLLMEDPNMPRQPTAAESINQRLSRRFTTAGSESSNSFQGMEESGSSIRSSWTGTAGVGAATKEGGATGERDSANSGSRAVARSGSNTRRIRWGSPAVLHQPVSSAMNRAHRASAPGDTLPSREGCIKPGSLTERAQAHAPSQRHTRGRSQSSDGSSHAHANSSEQGTSSSSGGKTRVTWDTQGGSSRWDVGSSSRGGLSHSSSHYFGGLSHSPSSNAGAGLSNSASLSLPDRSRATSGVLSDAGASSTASAGQQADPLYKRRSSRGPPSINVSMRGRGQGGMTAEEEAHARAQALSQRVAMEHASGISMDSRTTTSSELPLPHNLSNKGPRPSSSSSEYPQEYSHARHLERKLSSLRLRRLRRSSTGSSFFGSEAHHGSDDDSPGGWGGYRGLRPFNSLSGRLYRPASIITINSLYDGDDATDGKRSSGGFTASRGPSVVNSPSPWHQPPTPSRHARGFSWLPESQLLPHARGLSLADSQLSFQIKHHSRSPSAFTHHSRSPSHATHSRSPSHTAATAAHACTPTRVATSTSFARTPSNRTAASAPSTSITSPWQAGNAYPPLGTATGVSAVSGNAASKDASALLPTSGGSVPLPLQPPPSPSPSTLHPHLSRSLTSRSAASRGVSGASQPGGMWRASSSGDSSASASTVSRTPPASMSGSSRLGAPTQGTELGAGNGNTGNASSAGGNTSVRPPPPLPKLRASAGGNGGGLGGLSIADVRAHLLLLASTPLNALTPSLGHTAAKRAAARQQHAQQYAAWYSDGCELQNSDTTNASSDSPFHTAAAAAGPGWSSTGHSVGNTSSSGGALAAFAVGRSPRAQRDGRCPNAGPGLDANSTLETVDEQPSLPEGGLGFASGGKGTSVHAGGHGKPHGVAQGGARSKVVSEESSGLSVCTEGGKRVSERSESSATSPYLQSQPSQLSPQSTSGAGATRASRGACAHDHMLQRRQKYALRAAGLMTAGLFPDGGEGVSDASSPPHTTGVGAGAPALPAGMAASAAQRSVHAARSKQSSSAGSVLLHMPPTHARTHTSVSPRPERHAPPSTSATFPPAAGHTRAGITTPSSADTAADVEEQPEPPPWLVLPSLSQRKPGITHSSGSSASVASLSASLSADNSNSALQQNQLPSPLQPQSLTSAGPGTPQGGAQQAPARSPSRTSLSNEAHTEAHSSSASVITTSLLDMEEGATQAGSSEGGAPSQPPTRRAISNTALIGGDGGSGGTPSHHGGSGLGARQLLRARTSIRSASRGSINLEPIPSSSALALAERHTRQGEGQASRDAGEGEGEVGSQGGDELSLRYDASERSSIAALVGSTRDSSSSSPPHTKRPSLAELAASSARGNSFTFDEQLRFLQANPGSRLAQGSSYGSPAASITSPTLSPSPEPIMLPSPEGRCEGTQETQQQQQQQQELQEQEQGHVNVSPQLQQQQQQQQKQQQPKADEQGAKDGKVASTQQQEEGSAFDAPGFVENVNKYLLGPAPPRRAQTLNTEATFNYLKAMLSHLLQATEVIHVKGYRALVQHVERFSKLRAGVVARSAAHYLIAGKAWGAGMAKAVVAASQAATDSGPQAANGHTQPQTSNGSSTPADSSDSLPSPHWVLDRPMMAEACAMPDAPGAAGPDADMFLDQIVIASSNWTQSMLLNSCRQRRRLRRGLDDWANMYQHALNADMSKDFQEFTKRAQWNWKPPKDEASIEWYPGPLTTWVECQTAASEALHLLLGFELELYLPSEFAMIYWYCSILLGAQKLTSQVQHSYCCPAGGVSKSSLSLPAKPGKKGKASQGPQLSPSAQEATALRQAGLVVDVMRAELMGGMCLGLVRLQLALKVAGIVPDPHLTFNTMRERFDQRFASFHTPPLMRPEPMTYNQYLEAVADADKMAPEKLLALAMDSFAMVRQNHAQSTATIGSTRPMMSKAVPADQVAEYQAIDRIALANILACNILIKSLTSRASSEQQRTKPDVCITYNWSSHPFFPSLGVKSAPKS